jgi:hypothetical protein
MSIKYPINPSLGASVKAFPKTQYDKIKEMIDAINGLATTATLGATTTTTLSVSGQLTTAAGVLANHTGVAVNTTALATLATVQAGVVAGLMTSTSILPVTVTLPSATVLATALGAAAGSWYDFVIDNNPGSDTVTLALDAGGTISLITPAITGGATLTVSVLNAVATFRLYFTSSTTARIFRLA